LQVFVDPRRRLIFFTQAKLGSSTLKRHMQVEHGNWISFAGAGPWLLRWRHKVPANELAGYRMVSFKREPESKFRSGVSELWARVGGWQEESLEIHGHSGLATAEWTPAQLFASPQDFVRMCLRRMLIDPTFDTHITPQFPAFYLPALHRAPNGHVSTSQDGPMLPLNMSTDVHDIKDMSRLMGTLLQPVAGPGGTVAANESWAATVHAKVHERKATTTSRAKLKGTERRTEQMNRNFSEHEIKRPLNPAEHHGVCCVYWEDYVCLGYPLPPDCQGFATRGEVCAAACDAYQIGPVVRYKQKKTVPFCRMQGQRQT
jgi:hypothetical protein